MKKQDSSIALLATERALQSVTACNRVLVRAKSEPEMLRDICQTIIEQTGYRMAWIGFPEMDEKKLMRVVACAGFEEGYLEKANITWREDDERGQGPSGVSYRTGKIVVSNNFQTDPITRPWRAEAKARGYNSSISMPLKHAEECFGMMMIYAEQTDAFQDRERQLLAGLADDISYGIHALRLTQRHKKAEVISQEFSERLQIATRAAHIGIWEWDVVVDVQIWDDTICDIYGVPHGSFNEGVIKWSEYIHPEDKDRVNDELQAALRGEREYAPEFRIIRPDGSIRIIKANSQTFFDSNGKPLRMVGTNIDITEQRQTQADLRTSMLYTRSLIEASLDPLVTISAEGKITDVNEASVQATGQTREQLIGTDFSDYFTEPAQARAGYRRVFDEGFVRDYPLAIRHTNGHLTEVLYNASLYRDEHGQVLGVFAAARDITEQKLAQAEKARLLAIIEESPDFIGIADMQGNLLYQNRAGMKMVGLPEDASLAGMTVKNMQPEWAWKRVIEEGFPTVLEKSYWKSETALLHRNGTEIPVSQIVVAHRDASGKPQFLSTIIRDITERKLAEEEIKKLNFELERRVQERTAQLENSNQELEAFSYSVSHDLRAPLRSIDGFSRILLEDYSDKLDEQAQDNLHRVRAASQRMGQLIDDLLQLSHYSRSLLHRIPVDLSTLARAVADEIQTQDPERKVEFAISPDLQVVADPGLIRIVLANLLDNAWKFTSKTAAARIELGCTIINGAHAYFVRDNGAGFDMAYADKLFGVFQRLHTTSEFPGTGIGLTIIQRIIRRHGGQIWAEGQVNQGATFYFTLPDAIPTNPQHNNHENENQASAPEKGKAQP